MKKNLIWALAILTLLVLTACNKNQPSNEVPEMLDVKLTVNPEKGEINQPIIFEAKVTQGNENVEDAKSIKFEIWRAHAEEHEKIDVKHAEDGIYRLEKTFQEEGTYYIISHVTARDMHNMPKKEFVVGTPSEPEDPSDAKDSMEDMDMEGH
ncbi:FixH family protein [Neobacillus sp. K501]